VQELMCFETGLDEIDLLMAINAADHKHNLNDYSLKDSVKIT
jgi:hypothetical protein